MGFTIRPLTPERWPALEQLFGKAGASNGCWCMYWRLGPRYHERQRELNRQDRRQLAASAPASGLLAYDGDIAVGWAELAPRADLPWLNQTRFLRPVDDLPVWSVPCFYVRRTHRGLGVMGALIAGAVQAASAARPGGGVLSRRYAGDRSHRQPVPRRRIDLRRARLRGRRAPQTGPAGDAPVDRRPRVTLAR